MQIIRHLSVKQETELVTNIIFPAIKRSMKSKSPFIRSVGKCMNLTINLSKEFLGLFGILIDLFPNEFGDVACLRHPDIEQDFFSNITHIQIHRRLKALRKFQKKLTVNKISMVDQFPS